MNWSDWFKNLHKMCSTWFFDQNTGNFGHYDCPTVCKDIWDNDIVSFVLQVFNKQGELLTKDYNHNIKIESGWKENIVPVEESQVPEPARKIYHIFCHGEPT